MKAHDFSTKFPSGGAWWFLGEGTPVARFGGGKPGGVIIIKAGEFKRNIAIRHLLPESRR
jgi:hypothetical protein